MIVSYYFILILIESVEMYCTVEAFNFNVWYHYKNLKISERKNKLKEVNN